MSDFEDKLNSILSSPEEMKKIMDLARTFSDTSSPSAEEHMQKNKSNFTSAAPGLGDIDPKMFRLMNTLITNYSSSNNEKIALLNSLKPYLKEDRHTKIDKAVEIAKLAKLAKLALSEFSGGDFNL